MTTRINVSAINDKPGEQVPLHKDIEMQSADQEQM
jgi:hypothetical protein